MEPIIGISSLHYNWKNIEEAFKRCKVEFGFNVIEFSYSELLNESDFLKMKELKNEYNLQLGLHIWDNIPQLGKEKSILKLEGYLNLCLKGGIDFLTAHLGKYPERKEGLNIVFEVLSEIIFQYERENIKICIENHYIDELGNSPEEFLYFFERINSSFLKFCFDYGHANLTKNIFEFIEKLNKYFEIVHISDNNGDKDEHLHYKDGNIKWNEVLSFTLKKGFYGPYIIEFGGRDEKVEKFKNFENDIKDILKNL
jgi:sugar phosphate isomerase/epimerase